MCAIICAMAVQQNVGQLLTKRAYRDPAAEAVYEPALDRRFSFSELNGRCNQVANALRDGGVQHGDRVALLLMNGTEFVESFFAVGKIGAVNVPLNWRLVADELEFILADAGATVLLFGSDFAEVVAELQRRGDKTAIGTWIEVGAGANAAEATSVEGALAYDEWMGAASAEEPEASGSGDDLMFIMYTSGTTGLPKGVMHSHDTVLWSILTGVATADFQMADRYLISLPMFHVGALNPVLSCIYGGCSLIILKAFDPLKSWELIRDERITVTLMVPVMLQFMLAVRDPELHDASSLRWVMSGAAPVAKTLIEQYDALDIEIHQVYGLTETGGPGCLISSADAIKRAGSTGKAFYFTQVRVVNDAGDDVGIDESGEVLIKGPNVMVGYWNRPEATAEAIVDGWLHTGDVATMDDDGFVTIVDRVKDMLISGGENVYPAEIESVLLAHPKIADAGVIGVPSDKWGESPLAAVVASDETLTAEEVMEFCKGKLAPFKAVKAVEFVTELPRNPSGKILKRELRGQFADARTD
jgi:acyl-CoA synthetase (AMP-forming)/AMP-acid ligase II